VVPRFFDSDREKNITFGRITAQEMHELSIAMSIVDIATAETSRAGSSRVIELELEVGDLSGVDTEALEFALEVATRQTVLEHAHVNIHQIAAEADCNVCHHRFPVEDLYTPCPVCHSFDSRLLCGNELRVRSLLVE
jgi:hydrogenase nickel incorporation protein HypA/HybF